MTEYRSYLCVGGPYSGRRYDAGGAPSFRAQKRDHIAAVQFDPRANPLAEMTSVGIVEYRTQPFHTSHDSVIVWAPSDQSPLDTLRMLLETYEFAWKDRT